MNNDIGVMQGRLLPKYKGRYQAHPLGYWQDEFYIAKDLGLDCIEFILDYENAELNPLIKEGGIDEIINVTKQPGVEKYLCWLFYGCTIHLKILKYQIQVKKY